MKNTVTKTLLCLSLCLCAGASFAASGSTFDEGKPKCGPGSELQAARDARLNEKIQQIDKAKDESDEQTKAEASCQISFNLDGIRNAIPAALKGVMDLLSGLNPGDIFGAAGKMVGGLMTSNQACKVAKNVLSGAQRVAVNAGTTVAVNAVNTATNNVNNQINNAVSPGLNQINSNIYDANGKIIQNGGGFQNTVNPVQNPVVVPTIQQGGSVWNRVACTFGGGTNCKP